MAYLEDVLLPMIYTELQRLVRPLPVLERETADILRRLETVLNVPADQSVVPVAPVPAPAPEPEPAPPLPPLESDADWQAKVDAASAAEAEAAAELAAVEAEPHTPTA